MTKAKSRHGKLKGAVLLMVLAVMTVLIILLAGTIAVVYSAHNRSMLKYEESQAYYTSRSVLDTFTESMLDNETDTLSGRTYYYVKDDVTGNPTLGNTLADGDDYTLGMAIEEDIFKLPISTETDPTDPNYNEWFDSTFISGKGLTVAQATKYVNMASTDVSGESSLSDYYDQYTVRENWTSTSTKGKNDTITYKVGSLDSYGSGYGKMTDRGADTYITVQVLEREYDLGTGSTFAEQFRNGNRTKDYVKCKATAHVIYDGRETTTSKIFITGEQNKVSSSDAIVSLSDIAGADTVTSIGGASSLHNGTMAWSNNTMTAGNLFIWDSVTFNNSQPNVHFFGDEKFVALGTVGMEQYPHFEENGTIFYGQELDFKGSGSLASSSAKPNIVSPLIKISYNAQNSLDLYGRVFADTIELVDDVGSADKRGFEFYDSVYMNEFKYHQNVDTSQANVQTEFFTFSYAGGTVTIKPTKTFYTRFQGLVDPSYNVSKVNVEEKITLVCNSSTYTINLKNPASSNYFGGKAVSAVSVDFDQAIFDGELNEGSWKSNVDSNVSFGSSSSTKSVKINYKDDSMWTLDSDKKKMSNNTLPDNLITYDGSVTNKLILPTVQSLYGNYMQDKTTSGTYAGDTFDSNGNFNSALGGGGLDFTDAGILSAFIKEHVKTAEMVKSDVSSSTAITNKTIGAYDAAAESAYPVDQQIKTSDSSGGVISTDTQLEPNNKYGRVAIDARSSTINIQLGDGTGSGAWGSFYGDFVVYGDNPVNFLIPATTSNVKAVFGSDGTSFNIIDNDVRKSYTSSGNKLYIGSRVDSTKATPAPNINMYAAQDVSEITFGQGCQNEPFQCYIYAPFSTVALGGGNNGTSRAVNYNQSLDLNAPAAIIGSAFCYKYGGNQKPGVVYIDPNTDDIDQSKPKLYWDRSKWISSYN